MLSVLFSRITNAYITCCRISNPTGRRVDDRSAVINTARASEIRASRLFTTSSRPMSRPCCRQVAWGLNCNELTTFVKAVEHHDSNVSSTLETIKDTYRLIDCLKRQKSCGDLSLGGL